MYQSLLNDILMSYNNKILYDQFNQKMFNYYNSDEDDYNYEEDIMSFCDKVLVMGNNNYVNVFQIRLESSVTSEQLNNWFDILSTTNIRTFIDTSVKRRIKKNADIECNNCSAYVSLMLINNNIILCQDCIVNVKVCGAFNTKFMLNFVNDKEYQATGQTKYAYTINSNSLNIFYQIESTFCRFIIAISDVISNFKLKPKSSCIYNYCQLCFSSYDEKTVNVTCNQCYDILNYRNSLLKEFIFQKFMLFKNLNAIDYDIIIFISSLLMKMTL